MLYFCLVGSFLTLRSFPFIYKTLGSLPRAHLLPSLPLSSTPSLFSLSHDSLFSSLLFFSSSSLPLFFTSSSPLLFFFAFVVLQEARMLWTWLRLGLEQGWLGGKLGLGISSSTFIFFNNSSKIFEVGVLLVVFILL